MNRAPGGEGPEQYTRTRARFEVAGVVQGVGFRPFVYSLARSMGLSGSVGNNPNGVVIEVEGAPSAVDDFGSRLRTDAPALARVESVVRAALSPRGGTEFVIEGSQGGIGRTLISPDVATCDDCLAELRDPSSRRHRHAFISCTNCGPRFTVVVELPYDRPLTTMASLTLCEDCASEYSDPADRRFHAQTVACRDCGPTLRLDEPGTASAFGDLAVVAARQLLAEGSVVAVKGLGGYHLACDALNDAAVATLRKRKDRGDKPFAVMVADLDTARDIAEVSEAEAAALVDPRRPCVLLRRSLSQAFAVSSSVAPGHRELGVMLAYTPVHHLLFGLPGDMPGPRVLVMTSGNVAGEPIVTDDIEARDRLDGLADAWLSHDREIHVPCDDSVVRVLADGELPVRRSRGYAPLPVALPFEVRPALAVGGDLKNTFCVADSRLAWLSAHVGDMDDLATLRAFERAAAHLQGVCAVEPELVIADRHPGYRSTDWARRSGLEVRTVQHHHAHIASAMADGGLDGGHPVIGFAFDGTGYGDDGAVWGGEVLVADYDGFDRRGHLAYTWLPGGDAGVLNPCRMALSHLLSARVDWDQRLPSVTACSPEELRILARQLDVGLACIPTSSMGRLFDAVSSLAGVCQRTHYEAEAAMRFEGLAHEALDDGHDGYRFAVDDSLLMNASPVISEVVADVLRGTPAAAVAARFHRAVAEVVVTVAHRLRASDGLDTVALSGGVFLNVFLTDLCTNRLQNDGFTVVRHRQVPPSDAGLALGQIAVAARAAI